MGKLEGKVAIVTGGTRGIGFGIVEKFLAEGAKVALFGSRQETVDTALEKIKQNNPEAPVMGLHPALTDPDEIAAAFKSVVDTFGSLDILANNAGTDSRTKLVDYTLEEFQKVMRLNVERPSCGSAGCCSHHDRTRNGGAIINTSSMVSIYGQPAGCAYPTSKFAVNGLTKSLARELAPHKIRVNAVAPGVTHTDMVDALPREVIEPLIKTIPLGRMGEPEDIANAFAFLASDEASYISGDVLSVDGLSRS